MEVRDVKYFKNNTMKFYCSYKERFYNLLLFGYNEEDEKYIRPGQILDVAFTPKIDMWNGEENLTLEVRDIK